jgi:tetratricopeptide (TPR) repeat protein
MAFQDGQIEQAAAWCGKANEINFADPGISQLWGLVLLKQQRWADAEKQFRKSLAANPALAASNRGLSESLRRQGQAAEALRFARRAVHWSGEKDAETLLTLADAFIAMNRSSEAREPLQEALGVAAQTNAALIPILRDRLRGLP